MSAVVDDSFFMSLLDLALNVVIYGLEGVMQGGVLKQKNVQQR